jgi:hypothetical protein
MRIIGEMAKIPAFIVCLFHVFSPIARCISLGISRGWHGFFCTTLGEQKTTAIPPSKHRTPTRAGAELYPS